MNIDFGKLTNGETKKIVVDALAHLTNEDVIAALREGMHADDLKEVIEALEVEEEDD